MSDFNFYIYTCIYHNNINCQQLQVVEVIQILKIVRVIIIIKSIHNTHHNILIIYTWNLKRSESKSIFLSRRALSSQFSHFCMKQKLILRLTKFLTAGPGDYRDSRVRNWHALDRGRLSAHICSTFTSIELIVFGKLCNILLNIFCDTRLRFLKIPSINEANEHFITQF